MINCGVIIVVGIRRNKQLADIGTAPRAAPQLESMLKEIYRVSFLKSRVSYSSCQIVSFIIRLIVNGANHVNFSNSSWSI